MDSYRRRNSEKSYNELLQQVHQQLISYRESINNKLSMLEEMMGTLRQEVKSAAVVKHEKEQAEFVNPLASKEWNTRSVSHLQIMFPKLEGAEVIKCSPDSEHQEFIGKPIYDEEPGEGQECWPEKEFILAALNGRNPNSSKLLQPEICTSERPEVSEDRSYTQVIQNRKIIAREMIGENPKKNGDILFEVKKLDLSHEWKDDCVHDTYKEDLEGINLAYDSRIVFTFGAFPRVKLKFNVLFAVIALNRSNGNCSSDHANKKGLTGFAINSLMDGVSAVVSNTTAAAATEHVKLLIQNQYESSNYEKVEQNTPSSAILKSSPKVTLSEQETTMLSRQPGGYEINSENPLTIDQYSYQANSCIGDEAEGQWLNMISTQPNPDLENTLGDSYEVLAHDSNLFPQCPMQMTEDYYQGPLFGNGSSGDMGIAEFLDLILAGSDESPWNILAELPTSAPDNDSSKYMNCTEKIVPKDSGSCSESDVDQVDGQLDIENILSINKENDKEQMSTCRTYIYEMGDINVAVSKLIVEVVETTLVVVDTADAAFANPIEVVKTDAWEFPSMVARGFNKVQAAGVGEVPDESGKEVEGVPYQLNLVKWRNVPAKRYFAALTGPELDQVKVTKLTFPFPLKDELWPFLLWISIGCFGICLGLSSQAILWLNLATSTATKFLHIIPYINLALWLLALAVLSAITITYVLKCIAPYLLIELKIYGQWLSGGKRRLSRVANCISLLLETL